MSNQLKTETEKLVPMFRWRGVPWTSCKVRKSSCCDCCGSMIASGSIAYRPLVNNRNRSKRLCCVPTTAKQIDARRCYRAAWQAAIDVLKETGNPAVMWGDAGLLHLIANRMDWPAMAWKTEDRIMAALNRSPGTLVKGKTQLPNGRIVSIFRLPESR